MKKYKSSSSKLVLTISTLLSIAILFAIIGVLLNRDQIGTVGAWGIVCVLFVIPVIAFLQSPRQIEITTNELIIYKGLHKNRIPISSIKETKKIDMPILTMPFGSKGYFGFIGRTMDGKISLVKNKKDVIQIDTESESYLISCETPEQLIKQLAN